jgi:hypothetical protein
LPRAPDYSQQLLTTVVIADTGAGMMDHLGTTMRASLLVPVAARLLSRRAAQQVGVLTEN